jgi:hypothetical protein
MVEGDTQRANKLLEEINNDGFDMQSDFGSVINLLRSESGDARREATRCFEELAERYPDEAEIKKSHVLDRLRDDDVSVRAGSISALKSLAEQKPNSVREDLPNIADLIQDKERVKKDAVETIFIISKEYPDDVSGYTPTITEALKSESDEVAELAAKTIVQVTDESDVDTLQGSIEAAEGNSEEILKEATNGIESYGDSGTDKDISDNDEDKRTPDSTAKSADQHKDNQSIIQFSKDGIKIKEIVGQPLTGGKKEVTVEKIDEESFPIEGLNIHVEGVEIEQQHSVRLSFEQVSEAESDTEYLLYFTADGTELREMRERVLGEGKKEVTIESITWDEKTSDSIDMWVSEIELEDGDPTQPILGLSKINKRD